MEIRAQCALFCLPFWGLFLGSLLTGKLSTELVEGGRPPFRPSGTPSPPGGRQNAPPKASNSAKGAALRRRGGEAKAFPKSLSRAGGPGEGQARTQAPRAGWELSRQRAVLVIRGPGERRIWAHKAPILSRPPAILWFLSHRWERNPPLRAEPREEKQRRKTAKSPLPANRSCQAPRGMVYLRQPNICTRRRFCDRGAVRR